VSKKQVIKELDVITSSGRYPDRANSLELDKVVRSNIKDLVDRVNALLVDLAIESASISSGFRPSSVNAKIKNAAKKSLHMIGRALDLVDRDGSIARRIQNDPSILKKHGLWLEDPEFTKGWCHLDTSITRLDRPIRIFKP
jgi:hypothetical protein